MQLTEIRDGRPQDIIALFRETFAASEGEAEGDLIGALVEELLTKTADEDLAVFAALENDAVIGAILFTRLSYPEDARTAFLLSPVAVATVHHGKGIGQALISYGLDMLRGRGVDVALTYGDINFYSKVGFRQITEDIAKAPQPLQYPHGWLGQSLVGEVLQPLKGRSFCVEAFNNPAIW